MVFQNYLIPALQIMNIILRQFTNPKILIIQVYKSAILIQSIPPKEIISQHSLLHLIIHISKHQQIPFEFNQFKIASPILTLIFQWSVLIELRHRIRYFLQMIIAELFPFTSITLPVTKIRYYRYSVLQVVNIVTWGVIKY